MSYRDLPLSCHDEMPKEYAAVDYRAEAPVLSAMTSHRDDAGCGIAVPDDSRGSQRDGLAEHPLPELTAEGVGRDDIHLDVKQVGEGEAQAHLIQKTGFRREVDEGVDVGCRGVVAASDGSEYPRGGGVVLGDEVMNLVAMTEETFVQGANQRAPDAPAVDLASLPPSGRSG